VAVSVTVVPAEAVAVLSESWAGFAGASSGLLAFVGGAPGMVVCGSVLVVEDTVVVVDRMGLVEGAGTIAPF
jgi:hypothetical protein